MQKTISPKLVALTFGVLIISFFAAFYVIAWTEPPYGGTCDDPPCPPGGNVPSPLNTGTADQIKQGGLTINGVLSTLQNMLVNLVTIKGDGSVSLNLNSDKLDDYHAADLMAAGGGGGVEGGECEWEVRQCKN